MNTFPPSVEEIKKLRENISKCKRYRIYVSTLVISVIDSATSLIIWDDSNELIHCLDYVSDFPLQAIAPYKIRHIPYSKIVTISYEM